MKDTTESEIKKVKDILKQQREIAENKHIERMQRIHPGLIFKSRNGLTIEFNVDCSKFNEAINKSRLNTV